MKKLKTKIFTSKVLSTLLIIILTFSPFATVAGAQETQGLATESSEKLTDDLKTHLETVSDDEYVPVYIWLKPYGDDMLYTVLSKRLGTTITAQSEEAYIHSRISSKTQQLKENLAKMKNDTVSTYAFNSSGEIDITTLSASTFRRQGDISETMTDAEIKTCLESGMSAEKIVEISERTQFLSDYRQSRKAINSAVNQSFYEQLDLTKCRNVYLDPLLARVTIECKKSYINTLENMYVVQEIGYYVEFIFVDDVLNNYDKRSTTYASHHMLPVQNLLPNPGAGLKIGVLEAIYLDETFYRYYDTSNPHLEGKSINFRPSSRSVSSHAISEHATNVLAILCGNAKISSNTETTYQGLAPYSTVSLANITGSSEFSVAMDWLLTTENVSIVNYSGGLSSNGQYSDYSKTADVYVEQYRVIYVNAAGNNSRYIISPALAYNAITVGNYAKYNEASISQYDGEVKASSCYDERGFLANKPDVCAVGTSIHMLNSSLIPTYIGADGTSFSAPMVSGTIALMMQANPNLIGKPEVVKNLLLLSADEEAIYYNDTEGEEENELISAEPTNISTAKIENVSTILREKSGAGLLNIPAAIRLALAGLYYDFTFSPGSEYFISNRYYFEANSKIEFGLVFNKSTNDVLTSEYPYNYNVQLLDSNNSVILSSSDTVNNVEMFSCTVKTAGYYKFKIVSPTAEEHTTETKASLAIACGCTDKNIAKNPCTETSHQFVCSTTGCITIKEPHTTADLFPYSLDENKTVFFTLSYLFKRGNVERAFECYDPQVWIATSTSFGAVLTEIHSANYYNSTITSTGEIIRVSYTVILEDNGTVSLVDTPEITIIIDYMTQTIDAYWS